MTPVIDFLLKRKDAASGKIALIGVSTGGYLPPPRRRLRAEDRRVREMGEPARNVGFRSKKAVGIRLEDDEIQHARLRRQNKMPHARRRFGGRPRLSGAGEETF